jgi:proteasome accessory factor A
MGVETEYALSVSSPDREAPARETIAGDLITQARRRVPALRDIHGLGVFLVNGARFYVDHGLHPEMATPECADPWELVRYVEAGHLLLADLIGPLEARYPGARFHLFRANVDYSGTGATWGCHESYMHRADPRGLPEQLIPHLVTRVVFSGSGGFSPIGGRHSFLLSPRSQFIECASSSNSTHHRGIFHTKDEPLAGAGLHRLHVVLGESTCSQLATCLKTGTTALVVSLCEAGIEPARGIEFSQPVLRLRKIAADPACSRVIASIDGVDATAIDVQRHYLGHVRANLGHESMPDWASDLCKLWEDTLDQLGSGAPGSVDTRLDWAMKHTLFSDYLARRGWEPAVLKVVSRVANLFPPAIATLDASRLAPSDPDTDPFDSAPDAPGPDQLQTAADQLSAHGLGIEDLEAYLKVRSELYEADLRFGEVGPGSIFARLEAAGRWNQSLGRVGDIVRAIEAPPAHGRARLRSALVRRLAGKRGCVCDWESVVTPSGRLDMSDPLRETEGEWQERPKGERSGRGLVHRLAELID